MFVFCSNDTLEYTEWATLVPLEPRDRIRQGVCRSPTPGGAVYPFKYCHFCCRHFHDTFKANINPDRNVTPPGWVWVYFSSLIDLKSIPGREREGKRERERERRSKRRRKVVST